ncbi:hypothetical protein [Rickettsiales endosymbiont of Stachyamoeba lipophora]|uniref:hypothetical protein n=1 Tax=Rickettsiales endosymbiont of Stachyamoeba lipophora TaxID=2486578 RepID=UPI000F64AF9C|nr:hypothetical protein [Rickettsiales endosymbiont of Stachyamoeba lipophora]AZL16255.1 hypothetical protein EF513_06910 [Rickettsiales endosymbiont of Stachyamoeba lipophora]
MQEVFSFIQQIMWPLVILAVLTIFGTPLKKLLVSFTAAVNERGVKLSASGIEIPSASDDSNEGVIQEINNPKHYYNILTQNQPELVTEPILTQSENIDELTSQHNRKLVNKIYNNINKFIKDHANEDLEKLLPDLLCDAYILLHFERCFQRILGSQLTLIEKLYKAKEHTISKESALLVYNNFYRDNNNVSFELWISYLTDSELIEEKEGDEYRLTGEGKEFYEYLLNRQYVLKKQG